MRGAGLMGELRPKPCSPFLSNQWHIHQQIAVATPILDILVSLPSGKSSHPSIFLGQSMHTSNPGKSWLGGGCWPSGGVVLLTNLLSPDML